MKPKKINTFQADTTDMGEEEIGEYWAYDGLPNKVGDLVILEIYPHFEDVLEGAKYTQKYPPDYLVLAQVTQFNNEYGQFFCKLLDEKFRVQDEACKEEK